MTVCAVLALKQEAMLYAVSQNPACKHSVVLYRQVLITVISTKMYEGRFLLFFLLLLFFTGGAIACTETAKYFVLMVFLTIVISNSQEHLSPMFGLIFISTN